MGEKSQRELSVCSPIKTNVVEAYGSREQFLMEFNPSWMSMRDVDRKECYLGQFPTLAQIKCSYKGNTPAMLVTAYLHSLSEYAGCKEKISEFQLKELASLIAAEWHFLKVSELALFFNDFKLGKYGKFYGNFDPMAVTIAIRQFIIERNDFLCRYDQEERQRLRDEHDADCVSYDEYLHGKGG